jgi:hypothetical protein
MRHLLCAVIAISALSGNVAEAKEYEQGGRYNQCIQQERQRDGGVKITNVCGEHLYITWREAGPGMMGWDLKPGQSWHMNSPSVGGLAVCRNGFSPVDGQDRNWGGYGKFRCVRY